jgi:hypothetical protein
MDIVEDILRGDIWGKKMGKKCGWGKINRYA